MPHAPPAPLPRAPPAEADRALFAEHLARTEAFSETLRALRCSKSGHFDHDLRGTLDVFAPLFSSWNAEILFVLHVQGPQRFNRLKETLDPVSARVLTDKLRHLEEHDFVTRRDETDHIVYTLTPHGARTARLLHPLLYYLRNREDAPPEADAPAAASS